MKASHRKRWYAVILIVVLVFLVIAVIVSISYRQLPPYRFLNGRKPVHSYSETRNGDTMTETIYSFKADYSAICMAAKSELLSNGYSDRTDPNYSSQRHEFAKVTTKQIIITIHDGDVFDVEATRDRPGHIVYGHKHGWVSVNVMCFRPRFSAKTFWKYWSRRLR